MLTATYSLVAISAEQEKTRGLLKRVQQFVEVSWGGLQAVDLGRVKAAFLRLSQFDQFLRNRRIERGLIPAIRGLSREADLLIAKLEALGGKAAQVLTNLAELFSARKPLQWRQVGSLRESMLSYCRLVSNQLELEEQKLIPLAQRLLTVEDWFRLASDFLARDAQSRRCSGFPSARSRERFATADGLR